LAEHFQGLFLTGKAAGRWLEHSAGLKDFHQQLVLKNRNPHHFNKRSLLGKWGFLDPSTKSMSWKEVNLIEYRLLPHRPGARRWSKALILDGAEPREALATVLDVPASSVELKGDTQPATEPTQASAGPPPPEPERAEVPSDPELEQERPEPEPPDLDPQEAPPANPPWSVPLPTEFILETPSRRCTWHLVDPHADRRTKPLNFAAMLRDDEGEVVLLTEFVCQSDWGPTNMLPRPAVH
jgi:hypothetical protein